MTAPRLMDLTLEDLVDAIAAAKPLALTRAQAAALLGVDRHRVGELVVEGHLRTVALGPGERYARIPREEVERLAREGIPAAKPRRRRAKAEEPKVGDLSHLEGWEP